MTKQNTQLSYPKAIGAELWLYFLLFIDADLRTGIVETTFNDLQQDSRIPAKELRRALRKLTKLGFIRIRQSNQDELIIRIAHLGLVKAKRHSLFIP